ncbi:MAG: NSS family neurotransmitter:Na+ symporter [Kiritimatiellia bacterium]
MYNGEITKSLQAAGEGMEIQRRVNGVWRTRWTFILAATGSAVGLGNIWKFPYIAGENGGGAFVLVYLVCIALIGVPIMIAEVMLGRRGRMSPINSMLYLARESKVSHWWSGIGWSGIFAGVFILSFYSVIAGWALHYMLLALSGDFQQITAETSGALFAELLSNANALIAWHTLFMLLTLAIVMAGVIKGLGRAITIMMPVLFGLLLVMLVYSAVEGDFAAGWNFMFAFNGSNLEWRSILVALGHAFFTLSLGMGAIMAYGAYMPEQKTSIGSTVIMVALLDTLVALVAGLVIFPIVFASPAIEPSAGPGLLFVSLPVAFGSMAAGQIFAFAFFALITLAALSSAISIIEPTVAWLVESKHFSRQKVVLYLGGIIWFVGLGTVFSFNIWADYTFYGKNFFQSLDFLTANIMMPLGGLCIALFVGWRMQPSAIIEELGAIDQGGYKYWLRLLRYVSPVLVAIVFVMSLIDKLS